MPCSSALPTPFGGFGLKRNKSIVEAVEIVAEREFGSRSETFKQAARQISHVRNAAMHVDLLSREDGRNAYYRWNASQALVEIMLLSRLGLTEIPNRTAHIKMNVMGKDMFEEVRKEELDL